MGGYKIMKHFRKLRLLRTPKNIIGWLMYLYCPRLMSDRFYVEIYYLLTMRTPLDLEHPRTFNEKIQWLKLYNHDPLYTKLVDKYRVKEWVAEKIGVEHIIPTLSVYQSVDDIKLEDLPDQFVLKCNHDSHSVVVCRNKANVDWGGYSRYFAPILQPIALRLQESGHIRMCPGVL